MVAWAITHFAGMVPRLESRLLKPEQAEQATNCELRSGALAGFAAPAPVTIDPSLVNSGHRRAYRFPVPNGTAETWLGLKSEYSSVVRSPLANDTLRRVYWTNPFAASGVAGDGVPEWSTYSAIESLLPTNHLGIVQPSTVSGPSAAVVGGTATPVSRSYVYTFVNVYGEESAPSAPSAVTTGPPDGTWTITGMPTVAPANPAGIRYLQVWSLNLYRTVTGQSTGAQFFLVATFFFATSAPPVSYTDTTSDTLIVNNSTLGSTDWGNPPVGLDGLASLPGGMLAGFAGNTVYFCEPNRPHAWPVKYAQSLAHEIVGMGVWNQSLVVLTQGPPAVGTGTTPDNFTFAVVQAHEPCLSRGSVVVDLTGVYYASQNGLIRLSAEGAVSQTTDTIDDKTWRNTFQAANIVACRHRTRYLAINNTGAGFAIDLSDATVVNLDPFAGVVCVWNDEYNGDTYAMAGGVVYRWDRGAANLIYRWRSKQLYSTSPANLGACQILLDRTVEDTFSTTAPPLAGGDPSLVLPGGVNAVFRLYAGQGTDVQRLVYTKNLTTRLEIFRLPSGYKNYEFQCEIVSRVKVYAVELASTMAELDSV